MNSGHRALRPGGSMEQVTTEASTQRITGRPSAAPARSRSRPWLFSLALVLLAALSAYPVVVIALQLDQIFLPGNELALPAPLQAVPGFATEPPAVVSLPSERINILVLGLDRRPSERQEPTRSDTMFVLTLDPATRTGGVLSIPRDLWVEIPNGRGGVFEDRINTAYRFGGFTPGYPGGAMGAARAVIEHNFPQIRLDYALAIDFTAFMKIVDTLGGVDVTIPESFRYTERVSVDDRDGVLPEYRAGVERMNGERALYYARYRGGIDGDLGRIKRQQQVMVAVANRAISVDAATRTPELWARFKDAVETDIPSYRLPGIALLAKQVGLDRVAMISLGDVTHEAITDGGADVLVADPDAMAAAVNELFFDAGLRTESARIDVQNSTQRAGLATATATYLVRHGLSQQLVTVSPSAPPLQEETVILSYAGKEYTARRLAEWLGLPASRVRPGRDTATRPPGSADIVVILGRDARIAGMPQNVASPR